MVFMRKFVYRLGRNIEIMRESSARMLMGWMRFCVNKFARLTVPTLFRCQIRVDSHTIEMLPDRRSMDVCWMMKTETCLSTSSITFFSYKLVR
jgi:hypothetical protein